MTSPIITSLLDLDFYKLTMLQLIWRRHRDVPVTFAFKNRTTSVRLAEFVRIDDLTRELAYVSNIELTEDEIAYLGTLGIFDPNFLTWLRKPGRIPLTAGTVGRTRDGQLRIEVSGPWSQATLWETIVLAIVNELYYREVVLQSGKSPEEIRREGLRRLDDKIYAIDQRNHSLGITGDHLVEVVEFGTRRRYSGAWQWEATDRIAGVLHEWGFVGTSNVKLAMDLGLKPIGTYPHEGPMVYSGIYRDELLASHGYFLRDFEAEHPTLLTALTDTFTSDAFFARLFDAEHARQWRGVRQDSGDPFAFTEQAIAYYQRHGIDSREKMIVFSDGLDVQRILDLERHCRGRIRCMFGWGTNLTNDVGFAPLSLVMKATVAAGHGLVKLSDNLAKAQGTPEDVALFTRTFGHAPTTREECRY